MCEKCIRNILSIRALGIERPASFARDVTEAQIRNLMPLKEIKLRIGYEPIVALAKSRGLGDAPWVRTVEDVIRLSRSFNRLATTPARRKLWRWGRRLRIIR